MKRILLSILGVTAFGIAPLAQAADFSVRLGGDRYDHGRIYVDRGDRDYDGDHWRDRERWHGRDHSRLVSQSERIIREPDGDRVIIKRRVYEQPDGDRFVRETREVINR